uniref:Uncharacterized protein n=1 Tax=Candidatus Kentrum sp. MB TaxID=2138164 RepID=A0A450XRM0_9GAMM|nr:MAG: hypothetical protein BECKMB1821G_GA0114241_10563 [Candidatus Kentron sp. MB]VFK31934.1 MAG: hypothetical protein BECKMB1821I_GA0114274_102823 [Candidatus Kentron sp. MB]VFK76183.1 MAG: hypothetical protein BECKMB1821H_GA0114242_104515 [Candidatus Kentron sp. MB]
MHPPFSRLNHRSGVTLLGLIFIIFLAPLGIGLFSLWWKPQALVSNPAALGCEQAVMEEVWGKTSLLDVLQSFFLSNLLIPIFFLAGIALFVFAIVNYRHLLPFGDIPWSLTLIFVLLSLFAGVATWHALADQARDRVLFAVDLFQNDLRQENKGAILYALTNAGLSLDLNEVDDYLHERPMGEGIDPRLENIGGLVRVDTGFRFSTQEACMTTVFFSVDSPDGVDTPDGYDRVETAAEGIYRPLWFDARQDSERDDAPQGYLLHTLGWTRWFGLLLAWNLFLSTGAVLFFLFWLLTRIGVSGRLIHMLRKGG